MFDDLRSLQWTGFSRRATVLVAVLGFVVLIGWALDIPSIKSVLPRAATMKVNTALGFLLAGSALFLRLQPSGWQAMAQGLITLPAAARHTALALVILGTALLVALSSQLTTLLKAAELVEFKVLLGFIGALALISFSGSITYRATVSFSEAARQVQHTQEVGAQLRDLYSTLSDAESAQRAYLLTGGKSQQGLYFRAVAETHHLTDTLSALIQDPIQVQHMRDLPPLIAQRLEILAQVMTVYEEQGLAAAQQMIIASQSLEIMNSVHLLVDTMEDIEAQLLEKRLAMTDQTHRFTLLSMLSTLVLAVVFLIVLFVTIRREMRARDQIENYEGTRHGALLLYATVFERKNILRGLLDLLTARHHYAMSAFYAYEEWFGTLTCEVNHGLPPNAPDSYPLGEGLVGEAAQSNQIVTGDRLLMTANGRYRGVTPAAVLAVPVVFRHQLHGVLVLASAARLTGELAAFKTCTDLFGDIFAEHAG